MAKPILELRNITKIFPGVKALNQVQFDPVSYTHLTLPTMAVV